MPNDINYRDVQTYRILLVAVEKIPAVIVDYITISSSSRSSSSSGNISNVYKSMRISGSSRFAHR
jgi:hypothetical protein